MTIHLEFGGSTAARTHACPGWHAIAKTLPVGPSSDAANLGTALHDCMEAIVMDDRLPSSFVGTMVGGIEITETHLTDKIGPAAVAMVELFDKHGIAMYEGETHVSIHTRDDVGGTADIVGLNATGTDLLLADFKFGDGILVKAEGNQQLMHYAMCLLDTPGWKDELQNIERIFLAIIQPVPTRVDHPLLSVAEITPSELVEWATSYMSSVATATEIMRSGNGKPENLKAGEHCAFCPAQPVCPAKSGLLDKAMRLDPAIPAELATALDMAKEIEAWIKSVRKLAHDQMDRGDKIPGWKLVSKRGSRVWKDNGEGVEALIKRLRKIKTSDAYESKLRSPVQMEKLFLHKGIDVEQLGEYYHTVSSGTTIAPESDKRPEAPAISALRALAARTQT